MRSATWHPPQARYEGDNWLTSLISLDCGPSMSNVEQLQFDGTITYFHSKER